MLTSSALQVSTFDTNFAPSFGGGLAYLNDKYFLVNEIHSY